MENIFAAILILLGFKEPQSTNESREEAPLLNNITLNNALYVSTTTCSSTTNIDQFGSVSVHNTIDQNMCRHQRHDLSWFHILSNGFIHLLLFGFTAFITYLSFSKGIVLFSFHPPLMTIGYTVLMTEAILSFSDHNIFTHKSTYKQRVYIHWILHTISGCSITAGFSIILANKIIGDKAHFATNHAIVGLVAICCSVLSISGGVWAKYSFQLRQYIRPVYSKIFHGGFGSASYALGLVATILAFYSHFFIDNTSTSTVCYCFILILIVGLYSLYQPINLIVTRMKGVCIRSNL